MKISLNIPLRKHTSYNINNILLYVLIFFGLFDTARNYTYLPIAFGYLKDITIFALFALNATRIKFPVREERITKILIVYALFVLLRGFLFSSLGYLQIIIGIIKFYEMFMLMVLFWNWDKIFTISYEDVVQFYVHSGTSILIFVNIFGYFVPNPIVSRHIWNGVLAQGFYSGRITVGQPPIAIYPVIMSLLYLMVFSKEWMHMVVYAVALFISTSNTGLISIFICMIILLVIKNKKKMSMYIGISLAVIVCVYLFAQNSWFSVYLNNVISVYESKIVKVISGENDVGLSVRALHGTAAVNELQSILDVLIGKGMYGYYSDTNPYRLVENTYISIYCSLGIIGLGLWVCFFLKTLIFNFLTYIKYRSNRNLYLFMVTIVILCHMYTLDVHVCYTIYFSYALFYTFCLKRKG